MTLPRPAERTLVALTAAAIVCLGFGGGSLRAVAQSPDGPARPAPQATPDRPVDPDELADAVNQAVNRAMSQMDVGAIVDEALRTAALALDAVDVERIVEEALSDARIEEAVAHVSRHVDADRIRVHVHRTLTDVDVHREVHRALEQVRHEDVRRIVDQALRDVDRIVREAMAHAREGVRKHPMPPR